MVPQTSIASKNIYNHRFLTNICHLHLRIFTWPTFPLDSRFSSHRQNLFFHTREDCRQAGNTYCCYKSHLDFFFSNGNDDALAAGQNLNLQLLKTQQRDNRRSRALSADDPHPHGPITFSELTYCKVAPRAAAAEPAITWVHQVTARRFRLRGGGWGY